MDTHASRRPRAAPQDRSPGDWSDDHELLGLAVDAAGVLLSESDDETGLLHLSPELARWLGTDAAVMPLADAWQFVHVEDRARAQHRVMSALEAGEDASSEHRLALPDGTIRWVAVRGRAVRSDGRSRRVVWATQDITDRKAREQALHDSEERLRLATEASGMFSWDTDLRTGVTRWSDNAAEQIGCTRSELPLDRERSLFFVAPEDAARLRTLFDRAIRDRESHYRWVFRGRGDGGAARHFVAQGRILYDEAGNAVRILGVTQDVTAQTRAESALSESERRFELLANGSPVLLWVNGPEGCRFVNRAYLTFVGASSVDEVRGFQWSWFVHPDDLAPYMHAYVSAMQARTRFVGECRMRRADGEWCWVRSEALPMSDADGTVLYVGSTSDISERRRAEEALRVSEQRFRAFMDYTPTRAWLKDDAGRYVFANPATVAALGRSSARLLGRTDDELFPPELAHVHRENDRAVLDAGVPIEVEETSEEADGSHRFLMIKFPVIDADGRRYVGGVALDVTAQRRAEEALREADRRKDEFLAVLAHELRNPLAPVRTGLELLRVAPDKLAALERVRPALERQIEHIVRLVDDLLDISRITTGRIRLHRSPAALAELVAAAVESSRGAVDAAGLTLSVRLPDEPCVLDVDTTRFVQVVSNLLHNAAKFTDPGGQVEVTAARVDEAASSWLELSVRDTGIGIAPELLPRIFDLFGQASAGGRNLTGLGIGLALARQLVEMHGGHIRVTSDGPGRGSAFTIRIPVAGAAGAAAGERPGTESAPVSIPRRVLVVDDNEDATEMLAALVTSLGGQASAAASGEECLRMAVGFAPDVILLDIGMPGMDGYETCRRLRAAALDPPPLIVALTGWGQERDKAAAREAGFDAHLTKPVAIEALAQLLNGPARRSA